MIVTAGTEVETWPPGRLAVVWFFIDLEQLCVVTRPGFQGDQHELAHALAREVVARLVERGGPEPDEWVARGAIDPDEWAVGEFDGWRCYQSFLVDGPTDR